MSKGNRPKSRARRPLTSLALGLPGLLALSAGCGDSGSGVAGAGAPSGFAVGTPITYQHEAADVRPSLNLGTYRYVPGGSGLSSSTGRVANTDSDVDYGLALRTASIKLRGDLPTLSEIRRMQAAVAAGKNDGTEADPAFVYRDIVHGLIFGPPGGSSPPEFKRQMFQFFSNVMRMGGSLTALFQDSPTQTRAVDLSTAPAFAARLAVEDKDMRLLFTQDSNTCPTFNPMTATFADGSCAAANNVPEGKQAGVLTNPGFLAQYYSNFGFRRSRLIQELFACSPLPSEFAQKPVQEGPYLYSSPWPFDSITNDTDGHRAVFDMKNLPRTGRGGAVANTTEFVNFTGDCQNCHSTQNHRAPLFGVFDQVGFRNPMNKLMVTSTATGSPFAQIQEYQWQCNPDPKNPQPNAVCKGAISWKYGDAGIDFGGTSVPDFNGFGKQMASDDQTAKCMMIRLWNNAYSRDDVVDQLALVPDSVISEMTAFFMANNYNLKQALYKLYTDANFIRF